jgi:hypothetical protein
MDLRIFIEPQQGASYERVLTLARSPSDWVSTALLV